MINEKRLTKMPFAKAYVRITPDERTIQLIYNELKIVDVEDGWLSVSADLCDIDMRVLSAFMQEYAKMDYNEFSDFVELLLQGQRFEMNIVSGDIRFA